MQKLSVSLLGCTLFCGTVFTASARADTLWEQAQRQQKAYNYDASVRSYAQSQIDRNSRSYSAPPRSSSTGDAGRNWTNYFAEDKRTYSQDMYDTPERRRRDAQLGQEYNDRMSRATNAPGKPTITDDAHFSETLLSIFYMQNGLRPYEADELARTEVAAYNRIKQQAEIAAANYKYSDAGRAEALKRDEKWALFHTLLAEDDPRKKAELCRRFLESKDTQPIDPTFRPSVFRYLADIYGKGGTMPDEFEARQWKALGQKEFDAETDAKILSAPRPANLVAWPEIAANSAALRRQATDQTLPLNARLEAGGQVLKLLSSVQFNEAYLSFERHQARFEAALYRFEDMLEHNRIYERSGEEVTKALWVMRGDEIQEAAAQGEPRAMAMVGEAMMEGYVGSGSAKDRKRGLEYITRAKDLKEPRALGLWSAQMLARVKNKPDAVTDALASEAFQAATEGALQRDANSLRQVALAHYRGLGTPKDIPKAIEAAEAAASAGDLQSENFLVDHYADAGQAGDKSKIERLVELTEKMVARHDINGQVLKASLVYRGLGYPQDIPQAVEMWQESAAIGNWVAARNLAKITGLGVVGDSQKTSFKSIGLEAALKTFEAHCDKNGPDQQYQLGLFYLKHRFGNSFLPKPDAAKAKLWLQKAAAGGSVEAKIVLANFDKVLEGITREMA